MESQAEGRVEGAEHLGFSCEACGARLEYRPGSDDLQCAHCGQTRPIARHRGFGTHDLATALTRARKLSPAALVPGGTPVRCDGCGAHTVIPGQASRCPFCRSPVVVEVGALGELFAPESVLPFTIDRRRVRAAFAEWVSGQWFAPSDLVELARAEEPDGVYIPYWSYDADTTTDYTGLHGTHYMETVHTKHGPREEQRTRWQPAEGRVELHVAEVLVCASTTMPRELIRPLEPWDLEELRGFEAGYLSGFTAERYSVGLADGLKAAEELMDGNISGAIRKDIGGDAQQILTKNVRVHGVRFKHLLLPMWISSFRYRDRVFRFVINARTGEVQGERPWSVIKVVCAMLVLGLALLLSSLIPAAL